MAQGLTTASCLQSLTKDHLVKNGSSLFLDSFLLLTFTHADVAANVLVLIFRSYLSEQTIEHLATTLRKGGIRDLLAFFPANKRENKTLDEHFRKAGLAPVAEWWVKKQYAMAKETIITTIKEAAEREETPQDASATDSRKTSMLTGFKIDGICDPESTGGAEAP
jgi:hypothetical protein